MKFLERRLGIASDHAGYELKQKLLTHLSEHYPEIIIKDFGCCSTESVDYPDYAHPLAQALENGMLDLGISICGTGNGIAMVLNKYPHLRAALCWSIEIAKLARQHNDANVIALPGRFISEDLAWEMVDVFLSTPFDGGRHLRRIQKISRC